MMAAGQSATLGAETVLLEKMDRPGVKLRITGQGRCNLTNIDSIREAMKHYPSGGHFVRPALYSFSNDALRAFFSDRGVPTEVQRGGRVFPASEDARDVVAALKTWVGEVGVTLRTQSAVERVLIESGQVTGVRLADVRT